MAATLLPRQHHVHKSPFLSCEGHIGNSLRPRKPQALSTTPFSPPSRCSIILDIVRPNTGWAIQAGPVHKSSEHTLDKHKPHFPVGLGVGDFSGTCTDAEENAEAGELPHSPVFPLWQRYAVKLTASQRYVVHVARSGGKSRPRDTSGQPSCACQPRCTVGGRRGDPPADSRGVPINRYNVFPFQDRDGHDGIFREAHTLRLIDRPRVCT
jgi:hypothetical protein